MLFLTSFCISSSGLFDFDLTFVIEGILFLFLSYVVTNSFLIPVSDQIHSRADFINYNLKKTSLLFNFGNESLKNLVSLVIQEENEMSRQKRILDQRTRVFFEKETLTMQNKATNVLIQFKRNLAIKFAVLFSNLEENLTYLTNEFFYKKFELN
jgi:hypothetical protein